MSPNTTQVLVDPLLGKVVCGCEILALITRGGMGRLYRARQLSLDRIVAVKVLPAAMGTNVEFLGRFRHEARALATLLHPNIVAVHDFGEEGDVHAIVMEYVEGESVADIVARTQTLPIADAVRLVRQAAEGLAFAHEKNIIHCDVKPDNILVTATGVPKLADFGLAKSLIGDTGHITRGGVVLGTPSYMSPEQCTGGKLDARTDIYSLGATLYRMVAGRDVFEGTDPFAIMRKHQEELPEDPRCHNPAVPVAVAKIILRMIEKAREKRYQMATDVVKALRAAELSLPADRSGAEAVEYPRYEFAIAREGAESGLITPAQIRACLDRLELEGTPDAQLDLPALLSREGLLTAGQLIELTRRGEARADAAADEEFARLAVEAGMVTREQLAECAHRLKTLPGAQPRDRFRKALMDGGLLTATQAAELMLRRLKAVGLAEDEELLEILQREKALTEAEVRRCIGEQRRWASQGRTTVLRRVVVELGLLSTDRLKQILRKKVYLEVVDFLKHREKTREVETAPIMPEGQELKLEDQEPCPACGHSVAVGSESCPLCGAHIEDARRDAALKGPTGEPAQAPAVSVAPKAPERPARPPVAEPRAPGRARSGEAWQVRLPSGQPSGTLSYEGVLKLVREKRVLPTTVLRGPLTGDVWRQARHSPMLCRLFGKCHFCESDLAPDAMECPACGADPDRPSDQ